MKIRAAYKQYVKNDMLCCFYKDNRFRKEMSPFYTALHRDNAQRGKNGIVETSFTFS